VASARDTIRRVTSTAGDRCGPPLARLGPRRLVALVVSAAVLAGCATSPPTPSAPSTGAPTTPATSAPATSIAPATPAASVEAEAVYAQIESDVQAIRGLRLERPVTPKVVDAAGMRQVVTDELERSNPPDLWAPSERSLKALGLLPESASLKDLYLQLLTTQTVGLYVPPAKTLYVLSSQGGLGPLEKFIFAHEFDHALQDQHFDLGRLDTAGESDRNLARHTLPEGDSTLLMTQWAQQHLSMSELGSILGLSADPQQAAVLASMPPILREPLEFPYTTGLQLALRLWANGGWPTVDRAYAQPPDSTEQLLHPEKYDAHEPVLPVTVPTDLATRLGPGWSVPLTDSFGELQLGIWLRDVGRLPDATAKAAAAGWGGDRLVVAAGPSGAWAVALLTRWDTPADAAEFQQALLPVSQALQSKGEDADVRTMADGTVVELVAPDATTYALAAKGLGLPD